MALFTETSGKFSLSQGGSQQATSQRPLFVHYDISDFPFFLAKQPLPFTTNSYFPRTRARPSMAGIVLIVKAFRWAPPSCTSKSRYLHYCRGRLAITVGITRAVSRKSRLLYLSSVVPGTCRAVPTFKWSIVISNACAENALINQLMRSALVPFSTLRFYFCQPVYMISEGLAELHPCFPASNCPIVRQSQVDFVRYCTEAICDPPNSAHVLDR